MSRPIQIVIATVVLLGLVAGGYWLFGKKSAPSTQTNTLSTSNTNGGAVKVNTPESLALPTEVKGDTPMNGTLMVDSIEVKFSSWSKQTTFGIKKADAGQTFVLVYVDQVSEANNMAVIQGLRSVLLSDGTTTYPLLDMKIVGTYVKNDRGLLKFTVPENATNLKLVLGSGSARQSVPLP